MLARRPGDGSLVWAYQFTPHDNWDYDSNAENILADLVIHGEARKVLVHFDKNGFAYTLDRATGEVLVAEPFVAVNWAKRVDLATGRPVLDADKLTGARRAWCNSSARASRAARARPRRRRTRRARGSSTYRRSTSAWTGRRARRPISPARPTSAPTCPITPGPAAIWARSSPGTPAGKSVWEIKEKFPVWSGALATAGDVTFYGTLDGWFKAADAKTGKLLWKFKVGSGVVGAPITYRDRTASSTWRCMPASAATGS